MTRFEKVLVYPIIFLGCFISGYFTHLVFAPGPLNQVEWMEMQKDVQQMRQIYRLLQQEQSGHRQKSFSHLHLDP